jgi:dCMP deaminase
MNGAPFRPSLDETMIHVAYAWAARGTCARARVGAVLAIDGRTIASGYNGAPAGMPHCNCVPYVHHTNERAQQEDDIIDADRIAGHPERSAHLQRVTSDNFDEGCPTSVHAEANVVAFAARSGISTDGATLYTTLTPCRACAMLLINAGVVRVVAVDRYRLDDGERLLVAAGIPVDLADELP